MENIVAKEEGSHARQQGLLSPGKKGKCAQSNMPSSISYDDYTTVKQLTYHGVGKGKTEGIDRIQE